MTLAHPYALLLLVPAAAAAAWALLGWKRRQSALPFPASPGFWSSAAGLRARLTRLLPPALKSAALLLVVFSLARPQRVKSQLRGLGQGIDIMLAMDTSLSMSATDFSPNRLEAAKDTARRFIEGRAEDRIGIVVFGGAPQLSSPLTLDYDALQGVLQTLVPGMTQTDGTAIGDGLVSALNHLKGSEAKSKIIILMTDGRSNTGVIDPVTAAKTAAAMGVKVYTIGTAQRGEALMPFDDPQRGRVMVRIDDDLDEELLTQIAQLTDGRYFRATNLKELQEIYATIDKLEKSRVKLPDVVSRDDIYRPFVLLAALLLLAEEALSATWLLRWP